jgi:Xaa-Pro aminopeptidase
MQVTQSLGNATLQARPNPSLKRSANAAFVIGPDGYNIKRWRQIGDHMTIETEDDVAALKRIGKIVSYVLQEMLDAAEPGMTTLELDSLGERLLERHGARSAPDGPWLERTATCQPNTTTR